MKSVQSHLGLYFNIDTDAPYKKIGRSWGDFDGPPDEYMVANVFMSIARFNEHYAKLIGGVNAAGSLLRDPFVHTQDLDLFH